jgi:hypothetical protein
MMAIGGTPVIAASAHVREAHVKAGVRPADALIIMLRVLFGLSILKLRR